MLRTPRSIPPSRARNFGSAREVRRRSCTPGPWPASPRRASCAPMRSACIRPESPRSSPARMLAQEKLASLLDQAGLQPPRIDELPALIDQSLPRTQALLKALSHAGRASKISEELWFAATPLLDLRRKLLAHLAEHGSVDAQSFKELTGLTRKFAIPLLEY